MDTNTKKTFCSNCGSELAGNFCANCGTVANGQAPLQHEIGGHKVHEHAEVKARYTTSTQLLAGILGSAPAACAVMLPLIGVVLLFAEGSFISFLFSLLAAAFFFALFFLTCLPGILMIRKRAPEGMVLKTCIRFMLKAAVCYLACCLSIMACCFIIGILLGAWRLGTSTLKCSAKDYTAFVDGKKISVTRIEDPEFSTPDQTRYIYIAENGDLYRPSIL